jgi:hypothetical protein
MAWSCSVMPQVLINHLSIVWSLDINIGLVHSQTTQLPAQIEGSVHYKCYLAQPLEEPPTLHIQHIHHSSQIVPILLSFSMFAKLNWDDRLCDTKLFLFGHQCLSFCLPFLFLGPHNLCLISLHILEHSNLILQLVQLVLRSSLNKLGLLSLIFGTTIITCKTPTLTDLSKSQSWTSINQH